MIAFVCSFICSWVCSQQNTKTYEQIVMKCLGSVGNGMRKD